MLDLKFIRENLDAVRKNCADRNVAVDLEEFRSLFEARSEQIQRLEETRRLQNENASRIKNLPPNANRTTLVEEGKTLKGAEQAGRNLLAQWEEKLFSLARQIPNMTHPSAPIGKTEAENKVLRQWGTPRQFDFQPKDHVQLGESLDLIDFERGASVAGQKFYYLKNEAVLLELALVQYTLTLLRKKGFTPFMTPDLAKSSILDGIGFNPRGNETQIYSVANTDLCLIATAEITLGGYLADQILDAKQLPIRYAGVSHCFRTEAGAAGRESKGLYRVHQFTKVEMFSFCTPEDSEKIHDEFVKIEEEIFQGLEIPYRVVDICSGDLGGPAYRKFDLEAWIPTRGDKGDWGEVTSTSNCTDYQSRRLDIRFRPEGAKKNEFVHMLNGTAIAISRALIAILENHQQKDGSVTIPKTLVPFMGGVDRIYRTPRSLKEVAAVAAQPQVEDLKKDLHQYREPE